MTWTAELISHSIDNGRNRLSIRYADGKNDFTEEVIASIHLSLGDIVRDRIIELDRVSAFDASMVNGPITPTPSSADPQMALSIARNAYEEQAKLVDIGLADAATLPALKQAYADALAAVK